MLLVNLGTPGGAHAAAVRRYLREFLSDPRVVEAAALAWLPILYLFVLRTVPRSPRRSTSDLDRRRLAARRAYERQAALLQEELGIPVNYAMRYGKPSVASALTGMEDPVVIPL